MAVGYDDRTAVLTDRGWVPWPEIDGREALGAVDPVSGALEYQQPLAFSHREYRGRLYRVRSEQVDLLVGDETLLWILRHDTRAARRGEQPFGLETPRALHHKRVRYDKTAKWLSGTDADVEIQGTSRSWVRGGRRCTRKYPGATFPVGPFAKFLGYYLAEGSVNGHQIALAQNRGPVLDEMVGTIRAMGLPTYVPNSGNGGVRTQCVALRDFLAELGHAPDKRVPPVVHGWTPEILRIFLSAMVVGDGSTHPKTGHRVIYTASPLLADALQVLAIKAGISANVRIDDRTGMRRVMPNGQSFHNLRPGYIVSLLSKRNRPLVNHGRGHSSRYWNSAGYHDEYQEYEGGIHCASVPHGLLLVRRNGKVVVSGAAAIKGGVDFGPIKAGA
ncbi:LAGLIDADG family homing endonuclease [Actinomadura sp. WAC 06369]|uniref:LAGLIDADG family homing endonuclease n=1 Tax=Actinomadura sp. WAC 06369 TaxID=2203193 RepID=UPI000F79B501|nr:LAGLIDADG family homing endonuclease [Actinomadura sp. WAC 06369]